MKSEQENPKKQVSTEKNNDKKKLIEISNEENKSGETSYHPKTS